MNRNVKYLILLLLVIGAGATNAQTPVITSIDSVTYWVGSPISVHLRLDDLHKEIVSVHTDTTVKPDPAVEILDFGKWSKDSLGNIWKTRITTAVYDSGSYTLPEFKIIVQKTSSSDTILTIPALVNVSTLPMSDTTAIAPIKDIIRSPASWFDNLPWVIGVIAFIALLLITIYFIRKRGKLPPEKPLVMTPVAASELALTQLNRLYEMKPWEKGKIMEYQVELTQIIRTYMANRYNIPAMEMSTAEILKNAKKKIPGTETFGYLGNLLNVADYVKFARAVPPDEIHEHVMQMALSFIKKTRS